MKKKEPVISWRLKLILALGGLGGLAIALFGLYVKSLPDLPSGPIPLSWTFKPNSARVARIFAEGSTTATDPGAVAAAIPEIDQAIPAQTEFALFALG